MAFDYSQANLDAKDIINEFGESATIVAKGMGGGGFDLDGNPIPAQPDVEYQGIITPLLSFDSSEIDGETILSTDSYCFFYTLTEPPIGAIYTNYAGMEYRIISKMKLDSVSGINVYLKLQMRQ